MDYVHYQGPGGWPYPFAPICGGEHVHHVVSDSEGVAETIADEVHEAIEDAIEIAEHAPSGAAEIPHDLHEELASLREDHASHRAHVEHYIGEHTTVHNVLEGEIADIRGTLSELGARVDAAVTVPIETAEREAEPVLEMPEEIIAPRREHPVRGWRIGKYRLI